MMEKATRLFTHRLRRFLDKRISAREIIFVAALTLCVSPLLSPAAALILGVIVAQLIGHPFLHLNHKATRILLQVSVVGLGFGMNVHNALAAGKEGLVFAICSITGTLLLGLLAGRLLKTEGKSSWLIACGTAVCGGSAIAAISPVIKADERQVSVAMGTIYLLNAAALFLFPLLGHALHLSQSQFGLWSAIAIQDTSSVVGAAGKYGAQALEIGTTVKLARSLWIIPVALLTALMAGHIIASKSRARESAGGSTENPALAAVTTAPPATANTTMAERRLSDQPVTRTEATNATGSKGKPKISIPWFIGLFILAMIANTYLPFPHGVSDRIVHLSKTGLTLTLFLIGAGMSRAAIRATGIRPLLQGLILWIILSVTSLLAILYLG